MTLTDEAIETLNIALEIRSLLLACINEPTNKKLKKANEHYTQRLVYLVKMGEILKDLHKENNADLKDIVRLENDNQLP